MKRTHAMRAAGLALLVLAGATGLSSCGEGADKAEVSAEEAAARAAAQKAAAEKAQAAREAALEAEKSKLAGMSTPFDSLDDWKAACVSAGVDESICTCAGDKTVQTLGEQGLYTWVWEGYVNRDGTAQMRSGKFFTEAGLSKEEQQKFADAIGACYTY
ncbi:MAG: hypothetical protein R3C52_15595 [Hyphomonadaceae bacterium]